MIATGRSADEVAVRHVLERWAATTRQGRLDDVLANHSADVVIYDVLPPLRYDGAEAYRRSWGDWQPDTAGEGQFALEDLSVQVGSDVAFAFGLIRCGGTLSDGATFQDVVRVTFCLAKREDRWTVVHQHVSKPFERGPVAT